MLERIKKFINPNYISDEEIRRYEHLSDKEIEDIKNQLLLLSPHIKKFREALEDLEKKDNDSSKKDQ